MRRVAMQTEVNRLASCQIMNDQTLGCRKHANTLNDWADACRSCHHAHALEMIIMITYAGVTASMQSAMLSTRNKLF